MLYLAPRDYVDVLSTVSQRLHLYQQRHYGT